MLQKSASAPTARPFLPPSTAWLKESCALNPVRDPLHGFTPTGRATVLPTAPSSRTESGNSTETLLAHPVGENSGKNALQGTLCASEPGMNKQVPDARSCWNRQQTNQPSSGSRAEEPPWLPNASAIKKCINPHQNHGCKKGRRGGRTQQIPAGSRTNFSSPASKLPFDLQGGTGSVGAGRDAGRPGAASKSLLCPAPPLPCCTRESSDLFSQKPTRRTQWVSFVQQQRQMQTQLSPRRNISTSRERGEEKRGREDSVGAQHRIRAQEKKREGQAGAQTPQTRRPCSGNRVKPSVWWGMLSNHVWLSKKPAARGEALLSPKVLSFI